MKYAIVTGNSKGLGASISCLLIKENIHIIGISRTDNEQLSRLANEHSVTYEHISCDLANPNQVESVFSGVALKIYGQNPELVYLINNAGVVDPIDRTGNHAANDIVAHTNINFVAPVAATNIFLQKASISETKTIVVNVTSGAAQRPISGWSLYCGTKAGLDLFTETVAMEQMEAETGNLAILFNPGIMDTNMQASIRASSLDAFRDVEAFKQYKENNELRDTDVVAQALVSVLLDVPNIENGKNYSIKELL
ncbi:(S)-benzoin forming benzil reductase [Radiobacillus kanasensis]|uniref:(S)-benzoin forming benzil reductase n=1 Tax=Radiobacillus kanasensis TaxID=2844358 RepID=UPI001E5DB82B|nr:(S)-benzoin forming benzil reductase [Radiobacillus kanasensis]UFU00447.1 (S)-benzoin forming benzil reductase [Radiobacillus kanasensis]